MRAIYITYAIEEYVESNVKKYSVGDIVDVEIKISGLACKVADRQREEWQSVLRCSIENDVRNPYINVLSYGKIIDRKVMIGNKIILEEDVINSVIYTEHIEDV